MKTERLTVDDLNKVCYDPWELCSMNKYCSKTISEPGGCANGCKIIQMYKKLAEYENLEEHNLLMKLPFTIGDIVYVIWSESEGKNYVIYEAEVKEVCIRQYSIRKGLCYKVNPLSYPGRILNFFEDDVDKVLFSDGKKAEKALEERQQKRKE